MSVQPCVALTFFVVGDPSVPKGFGMSLYSIFWAFFFKIGYFF
jgi:hypothetical protein